MMNTTSNHTTTKKKNLKVRKVEYKRQVRIEHNMTDLKSRY